MLASLLFGAGTLPVAQISACSRVQWNGLGVPSLQKHLNCGSEMQDLVSKYLQPRDSPNDCKRTAEFGTAHVGCSYFNMSFFITCLMALACVKPLKGRQKCEQKLGSSVGASPLNPNEQKKRTPRSANKQQIKKKEEASHQSPSRVGAFSFREERDGFGFRFGLVRALPGHFVGADA